MFRFASSCAPYFFGICLLLSFTSASAQTDTSAHNLYEFNHVDQPIAARQSSIYHVLADNRGLIWLASDTDGLLRFDGYDYQPWTDVLLSSPEHAGFSKLLINNDAIWGATWGQGLIRWDSSEQSEIVYKASPAPSTINSDRVQTLYKDSQNRLWIGTLKGLSYINLDDPTKVYNLADDNPLSSLRIWWLQEREDAIWVATARGVFRLSKDLSLWQEYLVAYNDSDQNRSNEIRTLEIIDGAIWIGTDEGLFRLNEDTNQFEGINLESDSEFASNMRVNDILFDDSSGQANTIWIGTNKGLYPLDSRSLSLLDGPQQTPTLRGIDIRSLYQDDTGIIWVGTRGQGLFKGVQTKTKFVDLLQSPAQSLSDSDSTLVEAVHYDPFGNLWLATTQGVFKRTTVNDQSKWSYVAFPKYHNVHTVRVLHVDQNGRLWVGTNQRVFRAEADTFTELTEFFGFQKIGLEDLSLTAVYENQSRLLFGIWGLGIAEVALDTGDIKWVDQKIAGLRGNIAYDILNIEDLGLYAATRYSGLIPLEQSPNLEGISNNTVLFCAHSFPQNIVWLCSDKGLLKYDINSGDLEQFGEQHGFPSTKVLGLTHDSNGILWVMTHQGLVRFAPTTQTVRLIGLNEGLPLELFTEGGMAQAKTGHIALASPNGAFEFAPEAIQVKEQRSSVHLTNLVLGQEDITHQTAFSKTTFNLPYDYGSLRFYFSVTDFRAPTKNMYRHRIVDGQQGWSSWSREPEVLVANLPAGNHVIEVEGKNSQGITTPSPLQLEVVIKTPWWKSVWFIALVIVGVCLIIYLGIRLRTQRLARLTIALESEVAQRTQELKEANSALRLLSETDYLTGLVNRRGFEKAFGLTQKQHRRAKQEFSLLLIDVDHFKKFNDQYGHQEGDACLELIAKCLTDNLREQDIICRWGGEEFVVLLPNTGSADIIELAKKLNTKAKQAVHQQFGSSELATLTIGVVVCADPTQPLEYWLHLADEALYRGKAGGRNQVVLAESPPN
ncbi:Response regulator PleD [Pseudidiomarina piscicola]|uniref:diguanylate cyclase n=1 Tax=Pseudidiomarina piscicola TaxID=2614830 RepID=A0A6S6WKL9_9GAMM|nr:ligand-binding sensor domain-containing diguanylate cyclase [Pseudidiomarina piscicola]CAB0150295.1 Response regulator PleD [Pseudidiomarina piscicola]VZT39724.1 Response regulator PleD [Pseudomonas aeruginosa]